MNVEQDLSRALKRKAAPPDLADRVLARLQEQPAAAPRRPQWLPAPAAHWLAAAAAVAMVATGATGYYVQQRRVAEGERALREVRRALEITSHTLAAAQRRVESSLQDRNQ